MKKTGRVIELLAAIALAFLAMLGLSASTVFAQNQSQDQGFLGAFHQATVGSNMPLSLIHI